MSFAKLPPLEDSLPNVFEVLNREQRRDGFIFKKTIYSTEIQLRCNERQTQLLTTHNWLNEPFLCNNGERPSNHIIRDFFKPVRFSFTQPKDQTSFELDTAVPAYNVLDYALKCVGYFKGPQSIPLGAFDYSDYTVVLPVNFETRQKNYLSALRSLIEFVDKITGSVLPAHTLLLNGPILPFLSRFPHPLINQCFLEDTRRTEGEYAAVLSQLIISVPLLASAIDICFDYLTKSKAKPSLFGPMLHVSLLLSAVEYAMSKGGENSNQNTAAVAIDADSVKTSALAIAVREVGDEVSQKQPKGLPLTSITLGRELGKECIVWISADDGSTFDTDAASQLIASYLKPLGIHSWYCAVRAKGSSGRANIWIVEPIAS